MLVFVKAHKNSDFFRRNKCYVFVYIYWRRIKTDAEFMNIKAEQVFLKTFLKLIERYFCIKPVFKIAQTVNLVS